MVWTWRYEKNDGTVVEPANGVEEFSSQGDAESWIGEEWKSLLEDGVDRVVLVEDGRDVYPMSLHEA
ncbi:hypothetical protein Kpho02_52980 [Kitasatospora phosalacinea]|uniref:Uncharacterized protein n=1 Tax=Kitasatospora phosalacinea TaxID=2065 RepID=A0A9W6QDD4_9ACTN|nr:hypothetical protein [Kitasatospora phosalacinea]GLW72999.1 hypothetical protein Kpho02_52980 [Kitasatospora phosalacinea]